jgi:hypothetical protein
MRRCIGTRAWRDGKVIGSPSDPKKDTVAKPQLVAILKARISPALTKLI